MWRREKKNLPSCRRVGRAFSAVALVAAVAAHGATSRLVIGFAEYSLASNRLEVSDVADPAAPLPVCHFDLDDGLEPVFLSVTGDILRVDGADGAAEFDITDIFAPERLPDPVPLPQDSSALGAGATDQAPIREEGGGAGRRGEVAPPSFPLVPTVNGLSLAAFGWDGVRIFREGPDGAPEQVTRCLTGGPALAVAAVPGGFAVALGTRGYAVYDLDESGLVTLRRQWPLETGRAVSAAYDPEAGTITFDCQEGGGRKVSP